MNRSSGNVGIRIVLPGFNTPLHETCKTIPTGSFLPTTSMMMMRV